MKKTILLTSSLIATSAMSHGALSAIANGDFESGVVYDLGLGRDDSSIGSGSDWFESTTGVYGEVISNLADAAYSGVSFQSGHGNTAIFNNGTGYIYQNLGTLNLEMAASFTFDAYERVQGDGNYTINVALFSSSTFTGANGTDVAGAAGVTALGTGSYAFSSDANLATNEDVIGATISNVSLAGATSGDNIWVRFEAPRPGSNSTGQMDNLTVTYTVPEPSSTALLGLGGLALILRRRK